MENYMQSRSRFLLLIALLFIVIEGHAQNFGQNLSPEQQAHPAFIGPRFGRTLVHLDRRMKSHYRFGASIQLSAGRQALWDIDL
jgi:hypothetical protein